MFKVPILEPKKHEKDNLIFDGSIKASAPKSSIKTTPLPISEKVFSQVNDLISRKSRVITKLNAEVLNIEYGIQP